MRCFFCFFAFLSALACADSSSPFASPTVAPKSSGGSRWQHVGDVRDSSAGENRFTSIPKSSGGSRWQRSDNSDATENAAQKSQAGSETKSFFDIPKSRGSRWQKGGSRGAERVVAAENVKSNAAAGGAKNKTSAGGLRAESAAGGVGAGMSENGKNADADLSDGNKKLVYVFRIDGEISRPQSKFAARAVHLAKEANADALVVDMNTPGGDLASTLEIMESLASFGGRTVCYVDTDAISAGSFIAVACREIFFAPGGVMGAAEVVNAAGGDVQESMKRKITSFVGAKVRAITPPSDPRRAAVQRAMNDPNFELKIGGEVLKPKGELLTLTAAEAARVVDGSPLISDGTRESLDSLVNGLFPTKKGSEIRVVKVEPTWADSSAMFVSSFAPLLFGVAIFLVVMDIKSGGLGVFSVVGFALAVATLIGVNMSFLAGHEAVLLFVAGAVLLALELFVLQGTFVPSIVGIALMGCSAIWIFGGVPAELSKPILDGENVVLALLPYFADGVLRLGISFAAAVALAAVFGRYFEKIPLFARLVLKPCVDGNATGRGAAQGVLATDSCLPKVGDVGVCITDLAPSGRADFGGVIVEVRAQFGAIARGEKVEIVSKKDFNFSVIPYTDNK